MQVLLYIYIDRSLQYTFYTNIATSYVSVVTPAITTTAHYSTLTVTTTFIHENSTSAVDITAVDTSRSQVSIGHY